MYRWIPLHELSVAEVAPVVETATHSVPVPPAMKEVWQLGLLCSLDMVPKALTETTGRLFHQCLCRYLHATDLPTVLDATVDSANWAEDSEGKNLLRRLPLACGGNVALLPLATMGGTAPGFTKLQSSNDCMV